MATNRRLRDLLLLAAALLLSASTSSAADFQYCNKGRRYPVKVSGVEIVPDPVVRGQPASFKISASTGARALRRLPLDARPLDA